MVEYCDDEEQKKQLMSITMQKINKHVMHIYASEVVEHMYDLGTMREKKQLIHSFYGNLFLILQENKSKSIRKLIKEKPMLKDSVVEKLESLSHKFIEKGLIRHTIVQAILYDYFSISTDEQQLELLTLLTENFPALLGSKPGLKVACGLFAIASSKDRRAIIKLVKPLVEEMSTNQVSSLFLLYVSLTLDDTVMSRKSVVNTLVKTYQDIKEDKSATILYSCLLTGIEHPVRNAITKTKLKALMQNYKKTTSKKEESVRRKEIMINLADEIAEHMEKDLVEQLCSSKPFVVVSLIYYFIEQNEGEDFMDTLYRTLEKQITSYKDSNKIPVVAHASVHRLIKELIVDEINMKKEDPSRDLHFTEAICKILKKDIDTHLIERSVFLLATIAQNEESKHMLTKDEIPKKSIKDAMKKASNQTGLRLLNTFMYGKKKADKPQEN
jgi:pumilio family protein 6